MQISTCHHVNQVMHVYLRITATTIAIISITTSTSKWLTLIPVIMFVLTIKYCRWNKCWDWTTTWMVATYTKDRGVRGLCFRCAMSFKFNVCNVAFPSRRLLGLLSIENSNWTCSWSYIINRISHSCSCNIEFIKLVY